MLQHVVPGPVVGLRLTSISATILQVSWSTPEVTNGNIQAYSVMVNTQADLVFQQSVSRGQTTILVTSLGKTWKKISIIIIIHSHFNRPIHSLYRVHKGKYLSRIRSFHQ